jgi:CDP-2,3-bis-(O-geranylgeranyl)-sn-glycerol synthase
MDLLTQILASFYYFLPAYCANMAPVIFKKINFLKTPVDFNKTFKGQPLFGSHKTWGGLILATLAGGLIFYAQKLLYSVTFFQKYSLINYQEYSLLLGLLLGFGAIFGDLVKSFFKRRVNLKPGQSWIPFDQLDFVFGALLLSFIIYIPPVFSLLVIIISTPLLHIFTNHLGYYLKLQSTKW